jgi:3-oxoadipate enol-lactonase
MPYHEISDAIQINYTIHQPAAHPAASPPRPWIILINGLADPQQTWSTQVPAFTTAGYTVLTYDNRGVGLSSRPSRDDEAYTAATMASDLRHLVTALAVPKPYHVLGVSMGGMIAQTYALTYCLPGTEGAGEILTLTLACTYAAPGPFCSRMFALWRDMARRMSVADVMRDVALWAFSPAFFADETKAADVQAMEAEMAQIDRDMGLRSYLAQLNVITTFETRGVVGKLGRAGGGAKGMQVVVLAGENDILIPVSLSRELHALIEGSVWVTTQGGHACMWEFPDAFNTACLDVWKQQ